MFTAHSDKAALWSGYHRAALLQPCSAVCAQDTIGIPVTVISGKVTARDGFWSAQSITKVGVWMGKSWWVWFKDQIQSVDGVSSGGYAEVKVTGNPTAIEFIREA